MPSAWTRRLRIAIPVAFIIFIYDKFRQPQTPTDASLKFTGLFGGAPFSTSKSAWHGWSHVERIFIFGDSYSTTEFNVSGAQPSPSQPLGNPPYPESERVYGSTWPLYLTTRYNDSVIQTYNFADYGATVDREIVAGPDFTRMARDEFLPRYVYDRGDVNASRWGEQNSLFVCWFGINEVDHSMYEGLIGKALEARLKLVFEKYISNLQLLYSVGARNFLLLNLPALERAPVGTAGNPYWPTAVSECNIHIAKLVSRFAKTHRDATLFGFDTYTFFSTVVDHPAAFSQTSVYKNTTAACPAYAGHPEKKNAFKKSCGLKIQEYLWHDALHPTYPIQDALADEIAKTLRGY